MDESCTNQFAYVSCCLILLLNIAYLAFKLINVSLQHHRRQRARRPLAKMTDSETTAVPTRMATRSTTNAAAVAAAAAAAARTTSSKTGHERLAQLYPHVGDDVHLPMKWNAKEKVQTLVLQQNDLVVTYKGQSFDGVVSGMIGWMSL